MSPKMMLICTLVLASTSCKCAMPTLGPLTDSRPADLGPEGLIVDQPANGAEVRGAWVTVTGWFDPAKIQFVTIVGAPHPDFYMPTGVQGLASVLVHQRADGRFIAPRVPVSEGDTKITVLGMLGGVASAGVELAAVGKSITEVPATLITSPASGAGPLKVSMKAFASAAVSTWQWDFEGDATFDAEGPTADHEYSSGVYQLLARTRVDGQWVYATTSLRVQDPSMVTHSASVGNPRAIAVVPALAAEMIAEDEFARTRAVMVADGDEVKVFDARLKPIVTLKGLSSPTGMAGDDQGRFYVADTGNNRVARFTSDGRYDTSIDGPADAGFKSPSSLGLGFVGEKDGEEAVLFVLDEGGRVTACQIGVKTRCRRVKPDKLDAFVIPPSWLEGSTCSGLGSPSHLWARVGPTLYGTGIGGLVPLPPVSGIRDFTGSFDEVNPYWAAIDG